MAKARPSDEKRAKATGGNTRTRKSRRHLAAWTNSDGAAALMEPQLRGAVTEGLRELYLDAKRAHVADELYRETLDKLRALLPVSVDGTRRVFVETRPGWGVWEERGDIDRQSIEIAIAALESARPFMPVGETRRVGVDYAFAAAVESRADYDVIAEAMFADEFKADPAARDRLVQRVKDLLRR